MLIYAIFWALGRAGFPVQNTQESGKNVWFGFSESVRVFKKDQMTMMILRSVDNYP